MKSRAVMEPPTATISHFRPEGPQGMNMFRATPVSVTVPPPPVSVDSAPPLLSSSLPPLPPLPTATQPQQSTVQQSPLPPQPQEDIPITTATTTTTTAKPTSASPHTGVFRVGSKRPSNTDAEKDTKKATNALPNGSSFVEREAQLEHGFVRLPYFNISQITPWDATSAVEKSATQRITEAMEKKLMLLNDKVWEFAEYVQGGVSTRMWTSTEKGGAAIRDLTRNESIDRTKPINIDHALGLSNPSISAKFASTSDPTARAADFMFNMPSNVIDEIKRQSGIGAGAVSPPVIRDYARVASIIESPAYTRNLTDASIILQWLSSQLTPPTNATPVIERILNDIVHANESNKYLRVRGEYERSGAWIPLLSVPANEPMRWVDVAPFMDGRGTSLRDPGVYALEKFSLSSRGGDPPVLRNLVLEINHPTFTITAPNASGTTITFQHAEDPKMFLQQLLVQGKIDWPTIWSLGFIYGYDDNSPMPDPNGMLPGAAARNAAKSKELAAKAEARLKIAQLFPDVIRQAMYGGDTNPETLPEELGFLFLATELKTAMRDALGYIKSISPTPCNMPRERIAEFVDIQKNLTHLQLIMSPDTFTTYGKLVRACLLDIGSKVQSFASTATAQASNRDMASIDIGMEKRELLKLAYADGLGVIPDGGIGRGPSRFSRVYEAHSSFSSSTQKRRVARELTLRPFVDPLLATYDGQASASSRAYTNPAALAYMIRAQGVDPYASACIAQFADAFASNQYEGYVATRMINGQDMRGVPPHLTDQDIKSARSLQKLDRLFNK